jgi:hypothetical protein
MDADRIQAIAARDQLWASLPVLAQDIQALGRGEFNHTERELQVVQLLARVVSAELDFRANEGSPPSG